MKRPTKSAAEQDVVASRYWRRREGKAGPQPHVE